VSRLAHMIVKNKAFFNHVCHAGCMILACFPTSSLQTLVLSVILACFPTSAFQTFVLNVILASFPTSAFQTLVSF